MFCEIVKLCLCVRWKKNYKHFKTTFCEYYLNATETDLIQDEETSQYTKIKIIPLRIRDGKIFPYWL
jgi:hypothetical protein